MNRSAFFAITWAVLIAAVATTLFRTMSHKFLDTHRHDSVAAIASLCILLLSCIVNTVLASLYYTDSVDTWTSTSTFYRLQFCSTILYLSCSWLLKVSMLISYHATIAPFPLLKRAWFSIIGMVIMAYVCCIIGYPYSEQCDAECSSNSVRISGAALWLTTSWDMITNVFLIAFPIVVLAQARLSHHTKVLAASRFAVVTLIIWISLVRVASSYHFLGLQRVFWLHLWGFVQNAVFVVISDCLAIRSQLQIKNLNHNMQVVSCSEHEPFTSHPSTSRANAQEQEHSSTPQSYLPPRMRGIIGREEGPVSAFSWDTSDMSFDG